MCPIYKKFTVSLSLIFNTFHWMKDLIIIRYIWLSCVPHSTVLLLHWWLQHFHGDIVFPHASLQVWISSVTTPIRMSLWNSLFFTNQSQSAVIRYSFISKTLYNVNASIFDENLLRFVYHTGLNTYCRTQSSKSIYAIQIYYRLIKRNFFPSTNTLFIFNSFFLTWPFIGV